MPEEPTPSPEESIPSEESTASAPEAEWTDDMDLSLPAKPLIAANEAVPDSDLQAEWSDDMDLSSPEDPPVAVTEAVPSGESQKEALDWEDDFVTESPTPQSPSTQDALAWLQPLWRQGKAIWRRILAGVRSRLPITAQLSDTILSGILIGILVLLLTVINGLRQSPAIAEVPSPAPPDTVTSSPDISPSPSVDSPGDIDVADLNAAELDAPSKELKQAVPEPNIPEPKLDPAQRERIAAIQTQLVDASLSYGSNLLVSVQADFTHNQLTANLSSGWYGLSSIAQEDLANDWLRRSLEMNFAQFQLRSPDGILLARSPVIGEQMVILQREKPPVVEAPPPPRYRILVDR